ncbi:restriction endonuclease [Microcoleus sp. C2C3]|uniref:restriction endonuclease n=1 Tax=unclassified Microcoleus TaxID=2642155 RepID=UPI002FD1B27F
MSALDFKEIPQANLANGKQDEFELFARDFFAYLGYNIISEPDRGQDGGKDILIQESRIGIGGQTTVLWLVSCKHFSHSNSGKGKAVGVDDEINVADRLSSNRCDGFIGFYSTIASSGLTQKLQGLSENKREGFQVFHRGSIETFLFRDLEGLQIARRYFPKSMQLWDESSETTNNPLIHSDSELDLKITRQKYYEEYIHRKRKKES